MAYSGGLGVTVGGGSSNASGSNQVRYRGDNAGLSGGGPINTLIFEALNDYLNSGALSDMILGGRGFGQSRRFRQYNPYDPYYGYMKRGNPGNQPGPDIAKPPGPDNDGGAGWPGWGGDGGGYAGGTGGQGPGGNPGGGEQGPGPGWEGPGPGEGVPPDGVRMTEAVPPGALGPAPTVPYKGPLGPGQQPVPPGAVSGPGGWDEYYGDPYTGQGNQANQYWGQNEDAPVEGEGLLGAISNYGKWNDIDNRLKNDLGWQASGDLMDLENQELNRWRGFGDQNRLERATEDAVGWQRSGELSDLEQQAKTGYKNYADPTALENEVGASYRGLGGPGQYDPLRGETLSGMVKNPGLSAAEKSAMLASGLLPIQSALEASKLEGNAMQARTGNAAGRWGAQNAMALDAAGKAAQVGRNTELDAADILRKDRAEGLSGLGSLQGQIDARKAQAAGGLANLSGQQRQAGAFSLGGLSDLAGKQRAAQQFGINAGMGLNEQQRGAQALANQGIGNLGQRQRANTQWGLGALSDLNKEKTNQGLAQIGLTKDMWDSINKKGADAATRAAQLSGLVAGGQTSSGTSGFNAGVSV